MGRLIGSTVLDGLHGDLAEERARRPRRAGRREPDDEPPGPRERSELDRVWEGRERR